MNSSTLPIGTLFGIEVRIDLLLVLLLTFFAFENFSSDGVQGVINGLLFTLLVLLCILGHELGHAMAARVFGIDTLAMVLTFFGGYASLAREPKTNFQDAVISVAGPAVNLAIGGALYLMFEIAHTNDALFRTIYPYYGLFDSLMYVNFFLGIFNLLPAFPLDGGHIARAGLSTFIARPLARLIVARAGQLLAVVVGAWAFPNQIFMMMFAVMFFLAAMAEAEAAKSSRY